MCVGGGGGEAALGSKFRGICNCRIIIDPLLVTMGTRLYKVGQASTHTAVISTIVTSIALG